MKFSGFVRVLCIFRISIALDCSAEDNILYSFSKKPKEVNFNCSVNNYSLQLFTKEKGGL